MPNIIDIEGIGQTYAKYSPVLVETLLKTYSKKALLQKVIKT